MSQARCKVGKIGSANIHNRETAAASEPLMKFQFVPLHFDNFLDESVKCSLLVPIFLLSFWEREQFSSLHFFFSQLNTTNKSKEKGKHGRREKKIDRGEETKGGAKDDRKRTQ